MHILKPISILFPAAVFLALSGCASVLTPLGSNTYDCNRKENPASPYCHSFKSVEGSTAGEIPQSRFDETMRLSDLDRMTGIAPPERGHPGAPPSAPGAQNFPTQGEAVGQSAASPGTPPAVAARPTKPLARAVPLEGLPVREGPVVQRVWIKRFVDDNDLLVSDTMVYKEIIPSHWQGFPHIDGDSSSRGGPSYPHRPPGTSPAVMNKNNNANSNGGSNGNTTRNGGGAADAGTGTRSGFTQPGTRLNDLSGTAATQPTSIDSNSMPH
jgi:hypothetical protein